MNNKGLKAQGEEGARFGFGRNWARYLALVDDERIAAAEESLLDMLGRESLEGLRLLDAGSGSGLFSLAARNLGATVHSFDYDPESVGCTRALRERYRAEDGGWTIEPGDALEEAYLSQLGTFDVVYSWGVLHHTGDIWGALGNMAPLVTAGGQLFVALYNDQRWLSKYWTRIKQIYNRGFWGRSVVIALHAPYFLVRHGIKRTFTPSARKRRGMDPWRDILDWLGGYPFEVARPEAVLAFYRECGFTLERMTTVDGRHGCNEYVFRAPLAGR
ncbi:class I SAM-dependent methyltransferase [Spiribacter pallidus]|uniref:class I SAM-dependent methyltransferase n=1 Tax=Spiribacter pallidus TaxID=1987936 RepID=UPI0034A094C3